MRVKRKSTSKPLHIRKDIRGSIQRKTGVRSKRLQRTDRGQSANENTSRNAFTGLLAKELKPKSIFDIGPPYDHAFISLLYKAVKRINGFKDDKEWSSQPSLSDLAIYLVGEIERLAPPDFVWSINPIEENFYITYTKSYAEYEDYYAIPLQWLPKLEQRNFDLYQLTLALIYKVSKACEMELMYTKWDELCTDDHTEFVANGDGEEEFRLIDLQAYKSEGTISRLIKKMRWLDTFYSAEKLQSRIKTINPKTQMERHLKAWLLKGFDILKNPAPLYQYTPHTEEDRDCDPLMPTDGINFSWSFHDTVSQEAESWRNDFYQNGGILPPSEVICYTPTKKREAKPIANLVTLIDFMKQGRVFYFTHFDKQLKNFYDKRREHEAV